MGIVYFGSPHFAVPSLDALVEAGEDVAAVVTRPDKRRGRRGRLEPSPVKAAALARGLRVLEPTSMRDAGFLAALAEIRPEFLVVVAYGRILSREVLEAPTRAPVNLHASLLPRYRGASPIAWAILAGEKTTGLTTMFITEALDEGDIILQEEHDIREDDTTESLSARLAAAGGALLVRTLAGLRDGSLEGSRQEGESNYAPLLKKEDGRVDWRRPARELVNFVRGMHPWPGAFTHLEGLRVRLLRAHAAEGEAEPGRIAEVSAEGLAVGTGRGLLVVEKLQPESRRPMSAGEFARGHGVAGKVLR